MLIEATKRVVKKKGVNLKEKNCTVNALVSVIIVNWNGKCWLPRCLDSLHSQSYKNLEVILVDNASNDTSVDLVLKSYPEIKLVKNEINLGFASAVNQGIEHAKGDCVLLLNNDTWVENDFVEKLLETFLISHCDVVGPIEGNYFTKETEDYSIHMDLLGHCVYLSGKRKRSENLYLSGVSLFFRKDFYVETKGLDGDFFMYGEDGDWFWRLQLLGKKICQVNDIVVYHAGSGSTGQGIKFERFLWRNQNALQMLLKNYAWYNLMWVLPFYFFQNIIEILFFLIIVRPRIAWSYVMGWWFNIKRIRRTIEKRRWVQRNRKVGDFEIMKKMYFGFAKLRHLILFYKEKD